MAQPLTWTIDDTSARTVVALSGMLTLRGATGLRGALLKCLAEQPEALLLDLAGVDRAEPGSPSVFTAVTSQASRWPGVPVLLCAAGPPLARMLASGGYGKLPVHDGVAAAQHSLDAGGTDLRMIIDELLPVSGAPRHARDMVTEACVRWSLEPLIGPACLVASELVSNVIDHAGTMMTLRLSLRDRYLHISVRDGSPAEPPPASQARPVGSGLALVAAVASYWGSLPTTDGKVVWATLAVATSR